MESKTIGNYTFVSNGNDWFWDNDENGMTYLIWDRSRKIHNNSVDNGFKVYQLVMTPQSNVGPSITLELNKNTAPLMITDNPVEAEDWSYMLSNGQQPFNKAQVPEYIIQNESMRKYTNSLFSSRMNESDISYLRENVLAAYHLDESTLQEYEEWTSYHDIFTERVPNRYVNAQKFEEGFLDKVGKFFAGGGKSGFLSTALMTLMPKVLPLVLSFVGVPPNVAAVIGKVLCGGFAIGKIASAVAMTKLQPEYLASSSTDRKKKIAIAVSSQIAQSLAAYGLGAYGGQIAKTIGQKLGIIAAKPSAAEVQVDKANVDLVNADKEFVKANGDISDEQLEKMSPEEIKAEANHIVSENEKLLNTPEGQKIVAAEQKVEAAKNEFVTEQQKQVKTGGSTTTSDVSVNDNTAKDTIIKNPKVTTDTNEINDNNSNLTPQDNRLNPLFYDQTQADKLTDKNNMKYSFDIMKDYCDRRGIPYSSIGITGDVYQDASQFKKIDKAFDALVNSRREGEMTNAAQMFYNNSNQDLSSLYDVQKNNHWYGYDDGLRSDDVMDDHGNKIDTIFKKKDATTGKWLQIDQNEYKQSYFDNRANQIDQFSDLLKSKGLNPGVIGITGDKEADVNNFKRILNNLDNFTSIAKKTKNIPHQ